MTSYAVVEYAAFAADRQPQDGHRLVAAYPHWHKSEFAKALWAAIMALHALDDDQTKVLILSAHGRRLTGTMLAIFAHPPKTENLSPTLARLGLQRQRQLTADS